MRVYKIQRMGRSKYVCVPPSICSDAWLEKGVKWVILEYDGKVATVKLIPGDQDEGEYRKHGEDNIQGGENSP